MIKMRLFIEVATPTTRLPSCLVDMMATRTGYEGISNYHWQRGQVVAAGLAHVDERTLQQNRE
jgi:hypothetical protein